MENPRFPKNTRRILLYFLSIPFFMFIPLLPIITILMNLSPVDILVDSYVNPAKSAFILEAFRSNPDIVVVHELSDSTHTEYAKQVYFADVDTNNVLISLPHNPKSYIDHSHDALITMLQETHGEIRSSSGGGTSMSVQFADGLRARSSVIETKDDGLVIQVIANGELPKEQELLRRYGILSIDPTATELHVWIQDHETMLFVTIMLSYSVLWVMYILVGGEKISKIRPFAETPVLTEEVFLKQLLEINELTEIPFHLTNLGVGMYEIAWSHEAQSVGKLSAAEFEMAARLRIKVHPKRNLVTSMHTYVRKRKHASLFGFGSEISFGRSIVLFDYASGREDGLTFSDGMWHLRNNKFSIELQEIKNPLIECVVDSGWSWEPRLFWL